MTEKPTYEELVQRNKELEAKQNNSKAWHYDLAKILSPNLLYKMFESLHIPTSVTSIENGLILYANKSFVELVGYDDINNIVGKHTTEIQAWADPKERGAVMDEIQKKGFVQDREIQVKIPSGITRTCLFSAHGIEVDKKKYLLATAVDITVRKQAEEKLREAAELEKKIIYESPIGISIYDEDGQCVAANGSIGEIIGATKDQVLEQNYHNIESWKDSGLLDTAKSAVRQFTTKRHALQITSTFGKSLNTDCYFVPFLREGTVNLMFMVTDISELMQAEQALVESQRKLSLHLDQTIFGVIEWDMEFKVRYWNPASEKIFGYSSEEAFNRWGLELVVPENIRSEIDIVWNNLLSQSGGVYNTNENITKDGKTIICEWFNTTLLDDQGNVTGVMSLINDITDRRRAEEDLLRYREHLEELVTNRTGELASAKKAAEEAQKAAENANQAKSEFLSNMSHELRTPLNSILGFSQIMDRDPDLNSAQKENLSTINRSGEHLLDLINDILEISKIEAGRVVLDETTFSLLRMLDGLQSMFRIPASDKRLNLYFEYAPDTPHYIRADTRRLRQVLMNLLSNAIKFTEHGSVTFRVSSSE